MTIRLALDQTPTLRAGIKAAAEERGMSLMNFCNAVLRDFMSECDARDGGTHAHCWCRHARPTGERQCCWCGRWSG